MSGSEQRAVRVWLSATRPQFFTVIILPVLLGSAVAWWARGAFQPLHFTLALAAAVLCHAGANVLNDYFDHRSGVDALNRSPLSPYAGGSRTIQRGLMTPEQVRVFGLTLGGAGVLLGLLLVGLSGPALALIGLAGILGGYFYSSPPVAFNYRGMGEVVVGLNFGLLAVLGAGYVQSGELLVEAVAASLPLAVLAAAILFINEFPDHDCDRAGGKRTVVVLLGPERARAVFPFLLGIAFVAAVAGLFLGLVPPVGWAVLLAAPLAVKAVRGLNEGYRGGLDLVPGIQATIGLHAVVSALLIGAYVVDALAGEGNPAGIR